MIVTLVSDSLGESATIMSAILDAYLPRIGRRTWTGHISKEGLEDLRLTLRKKANRGTAIACHLLRGRAAGLLWTIGRKNAFGPRGEAPVSYTRKRQRAPDRTHNTDLLSSAVALSAGFHDLGKLTLIFQKILWSAVDHIPVSQAMRHEFVSLLLLRLMILGSGATTDTEFLKIISDRDGLVELVIATWGRLPSDAFTARFMTGSDNSVALSKAKFEMFPDPVHFPFMRGVALMVGTHHRLFCADVTRTDITVDDTRHVHIRNEPSWKKSLEPCRALRSAITGNDPSRPSWSATLARDARRAADTFASGASTGNAAAWSASCAHLGRLALMLGDQDGSNRKVARSCDDPEGAALLVPQANTDVVRSTVGELATWREAELGISNTGGVSRPTGEIALADPWDVHTHKVRRSALAALGSLLRTEGQWKPDFGWPSVEVADAPVSLTASAPASSLFVWQDKAVSVMREAVVKYPDVDGRLMFVMAGTGTGKTIAAPKLALVAARSGMLRLNVCLGLRSLTLQTGDEYRGRIGFDRSTAAVVIGSRAAALLHEVSVERDGPPIDLADEAEEGIPEVILDGGGADLPPFAKRMVDACRSPAAGNACRKLLGSPIVVCTVDTLAPVANASGGSSTVAAVRAATADLVLDEIDSYEAEDFVALCRIVEFAAFHGRAVTVASATLRREHAEALRVSYALGRRLRSPQTGRDSSFIVGWFSEDVAEAVLDNASADPGAFVLHHSRVSARMSGFLAAKPARRRASMVRTEGASDSVVYRERVLEACLGFHAVNHIVDPATGKRVSVGFVRWNRITHGRAFAAHLINHAPIPGTRIVVACHHSCFTLAVRDGIDRALAQMLSRKHAPGELDPLLSDPHVRRHLDTGAEADVILIVSTTPMLEAGRDLDFDWSVSEPCSVRSIVQTAGRVRRHRAWEAPGSNVGILEQALNTQFLHKNRALAHPGVESPLRLAFVRKSGVLAKVDPSRTTGTLFDMGAWSVSVDASSCIAGVTSPCGEAEAAILQYGVLGRMPDHGTIVVGTENDLSEDLARRFLGEARLLSVSGMFERTDWHWDDAYTQFRTFRRNDPSLDSVDFRAEASRWFFRDQASIRSARDASKTGRASADEWQPADRRVHEDWVIADGIDISKRLIFPPDMYDPEAAALKVEMRITERDGRVARYISKELRTVSTSPFRSTEKPAALYFSPILGGHHSPLRG